MKMVIIAMHIPNAQFNGIATSGQMRAKSDSLVLNISVDLSKYQQIFLSLPCFLTKKLKTKMKKEKKQTNRSSTVVFLNFAGNHRFGLFDWLDSMNE